MNNSSDDIPDAYQKGWIEFYKLKFKVTPDVLIPRPETELLVDGVLNFVHSSQLVGSQSEKKNSERLIKNKLTIMDVGTGAGNIAISIAKNILHSRCVKIVATDVSEEALEIAKQNVRLHQVDKQITFIKSNLLDDIDYENIDVIVTNLPYIPSERIPYLDSSVKDFEPHVALDGGHDGFGLYRKLFQQINKKSWKPGLILGEIDYTHGELAALEAQRYFPEAEVEVKKDLTHLQRILYIRR